MKSSVVQIAPSGVSNAASPNAPLAPPLALNGGDSVSTYQFDARFFTTIPNALLNMVQAQTLKPRDLFTYAYLKAVIGPKFYTLQPIEAMAADLDESPSAVKESLSRLCSAGVIRRQRTIRKSKTFVLVKVKTRTERVGEALEQRRMANLHTARKTASGLAAFSNAE